MDNNYDDRDIEEKIKKRFGNPPKYKISVDKRREFISRLYRVSEERKRIIDFGPVRKFLSPHGLAAALTSVALIAGLTYLFAPIYPTISDVTGTVKIYRASTNEWAFAEKSHLKLGRNDILKTFDGGQADLIIPGLYHIRLKSNSEIKLAWSISRAIPGDIGYILNQGKIFTNYNKNRKIGKELNIETPEAIASALGTAFMVESSPILDRTLVGVLDGVVKVGSISLPLDTVLVKAGQKALVRQGLVPLRPVRLMEDELLEMEELYNIGTRQHVAILMSTGPARTRELLSVIHLYISSEKPGILPEKFEPIAREISKAIREKSKEKHVDSIRRLEEMIDKYPNPKYDVQFLLFIGAYYEYLDEHEKAIATFQRVVEDYSNSVMASVAQCAIGIIYEEKLKDPEKARTAYQKVISNYPQSPEAEEALDGLKRLTR